jgi:hypothetical protein
MVQFAWFFGDLTLLQILFISYVTRIASLGRLKGVLRGISQALIEGILHSMASVLLLCRIRRLISLLIFE